ncbi:acyl-CoA dehydrogenase family protein [Limnochorda pilosa]|uniref:Acyl-CoA dehydrogenase n=1 Tax=Limnochorda pilosa TaxID=1555112 RepID=A0A0K2SGP8_LIMPI|nr:acyl-CoA dehydrogenase family protein [Limnochorda pilosa]BAS26286.1 acyl-CoA dehydrogenase [Limnochorda pilosa]
MRLQSYAYGKNHFTLDQDLQAVLGRYWPDVEAHRPQLQAWGELMGGEAYRVGYHVDREAPPVLVMHDLDGNRVDRVRLSPAQEALLQELAPLMRPPYQGGSWHHHYALGYLLGDPGLYCILTITQQVVYAIHKYAPEHAGWKERLLSGEAWGATWMTEIQGGSDLGANRTVARPDGPLWRLSGGDKYFASGAGLTDLAVATARPEGAPAGPKGLALFLVPRLRQDGTLNYHVRRLKEKSATRAVPSGEVELPDAEAFLIGRAEEGIYYTLEILTSSRLANALGAMGIAKKAHLEALYRVRHRTAFGKALVEHPLIRRDLVDLAVRQAAGLALSFRAVDAFDRSWHERPPYTPDYHYARFLSHLAKNRTADHAAESTRLAMELFGGLGFLEEYAVARWHREALITPIWEGPSNIQALDLLEAMAKKRAHESFLAELVPMLEEAGTPEASEARRTVEQEVDRLSSLPPEEAQWYAKHALTRLADAAQVGLLYDLAASQGDRYGRLAGLYARRFLVGEEYPAWAGRDEEVLGERVG